MADVNITKDEFGALRNEIKLAERLNHDLLEPKVREFIDRYLGTFVPAIAVKWSILLNEFYPVMQYNLPSIFFRNPRVFLKPRSKFFVARRRNLTTGSFEDIQLDSQKSAATQEAILNYELSEIRYKQEVRKVLRDALLFPHGVLWHGYKGDFGMTDERSLFIQEENVFVRRVGPLNFLKDPAVTMENLDEGRWIGRWSWYPLVDIVEDDTLDVDKKKLKGVPGYQNQVKSDSPLVGRGQDTITVGPTMEPLLNASDKEFRDSPHAKFVKLYEVFRRPSPKEKRQGKKGKVILLCFEQDRPLRISSWDYKAEGWPAKILMFNDVPETQFGLSDFDTYKGEADHKNLVVNQQIRNAEQANKVWVGISKESANEEDITAVQSGQNTIVRFESGDVRERMFVASPGGANSSELYLLDQRIDRSLQDKSGVSDLKRGFVQSGEESATSVRQRTAGGSARPAYRQDMMADFLKDSCHYLLQLIKQYCTVEDAVRIVGSLDIEWSDKPSKDEIQADVDVEIDVYSMAPENPEKEMQELTTILNLMVQTLNNPAILQKIQQEGKMFNLSPVIEQLLMRLRIRDPEVFRGIRPEESEGFVSVQEMHQARANVEASLAGQPPPFPPAPGQDHRARLEVYTAISSTLRAAGQVAELLEQLIQVQMAILQEEQQKENPQAGQPVNLSKPSLTVPKGVA